MSRVWYVPGTRNPWKTADCSLNLVYSENKTERWNTHHCWLLTLLLPAPNKHPPPLRGMHVDDMSSRRLALAFSYSGFHEPCVRSQSYQGETIFEHPPRARRIDNKCFVRLHTAHPVHAMFPIINTQVWVAFKVITIKIMKNTGFRWYNHIRDPQRQEESMLSARKKNISWHSTEKSSSSATILQEKSLEHLLRPAKIGQNQPFWAKCRISPEFCLYEQLFQKKPCDVFMNEMKCLPWSPKSHTRLLDIKWNKTTF